MVYAWAAVDGPRAVRRGRCRRHGAPHRRYPVPGMSMMHDMSLTADVRRVLRPTGHVRLRPRARRPRSRSAGPRLRQPRRAPATRRRASTTSSGSTSRSATSFHPLNAYDTPDGRVVVDLCNYERMFDTDILGPFGDSIARLERWKLDPARRTASITVIDERPNEFPRHRGSLSTKPYRYGYCASPSADLTSAWPTLKHDLHTGERLCIRPRPGRAAGEPVFVARNDGTDEDDGWLVTFVHDLAAVQCRIRRDGCTELRPQRLRRSGAASPTGALRVPRELGERPLGGSTRSELTVPTFTGDILGIGPDDRVVVFASRLPIA